MKKYGVMGDPIKHSMSPLMHNDAFRRNRIEADYQLIHVKPEDLGEAVNALKAEGAGGFNVTVPHKTAIIPFLDEMDDLARTIGAVNTVVNEGGRLKGYNTDGPGFVQGIKEKLADLASKKALIIGAGGAARGIYFALVREGILQADICNRTVAKAEGLIEDCPYDCSSRAISLEEAEENLAQYDLIVQTTSAGMSPHITESPIRILTELKPSALVSDIIYNPLQTEFLKQAEAKGASTQNGIDMFVYQGALAFKLWTGIYPDTDYMREIVLQQLGGKTC
ncbi:shikimate dehydrogenase [Peribacillus kribbensis]|uniref:shikimate dehydrogenase n=1 Tax=Peribacillus kribbensis TaxID=356658 RepID=UPI00040A6BD4|nr:shikimate dehydrogenase [Peribacillus kribbensis]